MKKSLAYVTSGLAAIAIGGAVLLAPVASAAPVTIAAAGVGTSGADPLVPFGTEPKVPGPLGYVDSNHDEVNTSNGQIDLPF